MCMICSLHHLLLQDLLICFVVVVVAVAVVIVTNGGRHGDGSSREVGIGFDSFDEVLLVWHFICI